MAQLLGDTTLSAETLAAALQGFRDDLHWLAAQVALVEGRSGADFLSRVYLEAEAIDREIEAWDGHRQAGLEREQREACEQPQDFRAALYRLREAARARQAGSLLNRPDPSEANAWFHAWQAASRLASRLGDARGEQSIGEPAIGMPPAGGTAAEACRGTPPAALSAAAAVEAYRQRAIGQWKAAVEALPVTEADEHVAEHSGQLSDTASESLTFLEEMPLATAVRTLEVLVDDTATCLAVLDARDAPELAATRRVVRRQRRTLVGELQDRRLTLRMEDLLGHRAVAWIEKFIFMLLIAFIAMLVLEAPLIRYEAAHWNPEAATSTGYVEAVFAWFDLAICLIFLGEFSLKLTLAEGRWLYVKRNWLTGLLPAIPVGFLAYATHRLTLVVEEGELFVLLRLLRYLRLPQMARWLRIARPALRAVRVIGFVLWASDRLVRQLAPLLNRNLVLFERATIAELETPWQEGLSALRERVHYRAAELNSSLSRLARCALARHRIEDLTAMLSFAGTSPAAGDVAAGNSAREIPLEQVVARLLATTPATVSEQVPGAVAMSVARWCRAMDVFGFRRLPLVRDLAAAGRLASPYETVARLGNRAGQFLEDALERVYWLADLSGILTAPQMVDSVGDWMVKGTARPARRFLLFGLLFLIFSSLASQFPNSTIHLVALQIRRLLGTPLIVLGTLCLVPLLVGLWFRQIAGAATEFYSRVGEAQFLAATKKLKQRLAERHHAFLQRRVIAPELEGIVAADRDRAREVATTVERLWEDYLDGAPFHRSDTQASTQLLGNLALLSLRHGRLRYSRRQQRRLRRLDLAGTRGSLRGPYLWFHFVSRSLAQHTARLVVDYDAFAIPLDRVATASDEEVRRYGAWLAERCARPLDELPLPPALGERLAAIPAKGNDDAEQVNPRAIDFQGTDFTAIHFLSADATVEEEIRRRYGPLVADMVRRDRRDNIRRVFRTYPFHHWPKERRSFNPLTFYQRHLAGGLVLLFPLKLLAWSLMVVSRLSRLMATFVRDVLHPSATELAPLEEPDPYSVALRKIDRLRKPLFMECLRLRADFDPEYLGVQLPGARGAHGTTTLEEDLALIRAEPAVRKHFALRANARRRQVLDFRVWLERLGDCPAELSAEALCAMAIAYTIDYCGVRTRLEAAGALEEAFSPLLAEQRSVPRARPAPRRRRGLWPTGRLRRSIDRLLELPQFSRYAEIGPAAIRRACAQRVRGYGRRLACLTRGTEDPIEASRQVLQAVGRDPTTWSHQLLVLRTVQTLSVLDLKTYCDLVAELGEYAPCPSPEAGGILEPAGKPPVAPESVGHIGPLR